MATQYATVEVYVMVDETGNVVATHADDVATLHGLYEEYHQPVGDALGLRQVKLTVKVPLPTVIELSGEVTCEEEGASLSVQG